MRELFSQKPQTTEDVLADRNAMMVEQKRVLTEKSAVLRSIFKEMDLDRTSIHAFTGSLSIEQLKELRESLDWSIGMREQEA